MKVVFLVSGGGGHLKHVWHSNKILGLGLEFPLVYSDRECGATEFSRRQGIKTISEPYSRKNPEALNKILAETDTDYIVTNIHKILDSSTLRSSGAAFVNLHYSLLPAYAGLIGMKTVDAAKADNAEKIGSTCHGVIDAVDAGPIILQAGFGPDWNAEMPMILDTVFRSASHILLHSLLTKENSQKKTDRAIIHGYEVSYSTSLCFDPQLLDNGDIWEKIKQ